MLLGSKVNTLKINADLLRLPAKPNQTLTNGFNLNKQQTKLNQPRAVSIAQLSSSLVGPKTTTSKSFLPILHHSDGGSLTTPVANSYPQANAPATAIATANSSTVQILMQELPDTAAAADDSVERKRMLTPFEQAMMNMQEEASPD
mmetsp:Transcript_22568/g.30186  ORF Transcript_22568/g.30186 Transcript_22568/m.30186 type:complete len:146 (-) Transcript_22568:430-867(-)